MDQVEQYDPPPNTAKEQDSRTPGYIEEFGSDECWELDALKPQVIAGLIKDAIEDILDHNAWEEAQRREETIRATLREAGKSWPDVVRYLALRDVPLVLADDSIEITANEVLADVEARDNWEPEE